MLKTAAKNFGYIPQKGPSGRGFGIACGEDTNTTVAVFVEVEVDYETIPVYARGGSFIPLADLVQNTEEYKGDELTILCYLMELDNNFEDVIYFDDGKLKGAYSKGKYELLKLACQEENGRIKISYAIDGDGYEGAPETRNIKLKIVGVKEAPQKLTLNNGEINFSWENEILIIENIDTSFDAEFVIN